MIPLSQLAVQESRGSQLSCELLLRGLLFTQSACLRTSSTALTSTPQLSTCLLFLHRHLQSCKQIPALARIIITLISFFFFTAFDFDNPNFRSFCSFHIAPWSVFQVVLALRSAMFLTPPLSCITKPLVSIHHFQPPRCTVPQASIALISARLYVCWGFPCNFPFPKHTPALLPPNTQTFPTEKSNRKESEKNYVERKVISWKKGG